MGGGGGDARALAVAYDSGDGLHPGQVGSDFIATQVKSALAGQGISWHRPHWDFGGLRRAVKRAA
jgi:hypothetical protein